MISKFFIERPIFASVIAIVLVISGLVTLRTLPIAQYPDITPPTVMVSAIYPGASAETVAQTVGVPIEQQVNGVEGMMYMNSTSSSNGQYTLTVTFELGTDISQAAILVQNRVNIALSGLPSVVQQQGVSVKEQSTNMLMLLSLTSEKPEYDGLYLSNYANINIVNELSKLPGVGNVQIFGAAEYAMRVWLDPELMRIRNITPSEVYSMIQAQNIEVSAGATGAPPTSGNTPFQYTINVKGRLTDTEEFGNIVIKTLDNGKYLRLKDIATIELGAKTYSVVTTEKNIQIAAIAINQLPESNALQVAKEVNKSVEKMQASLPEGVSFQTVMNTTDYVGASIDEVLKTLIETTLLVVLVMFIFLQNFRAVIIPTMTIPISLIGTFAIMKLFGFSINLLTLFGLVLAIAIVVDDAIVVVENVSRLLNTGKYSKKEAVTIAMKEIQSPIISIVLVLLAVFIPTAFIGGVTGQLYKQFALTIAASTVLSGFTSIVFTPAMCAIILKPVSSTPKFFFFRWFNKFYDKLVTRYAGLVGRFLRKPVLVMSSFLLISGITLFTFAKWPSEFIPSEDLGYFIVGVQLPNAASLERTQETTAKITGYLDTYPEVKTYIVINGYSMLQSGNLSNGATIFVMLKNWKDRKGKNETASAIIDRLNRQAALDIQEATVFAIDPPAIPGLGQSGGLTFMIEDRNNLGTTELQNAVNSIMTNYHQEPALMLLQSQFQGNSPQYLLNMDRNKIAMMGIQLNDVFSTLSSFMGSRYVNDFIKFNNIYQVILMANAENRSIINDVLRLSVINSQGEMVPFSSFSTIEEKMGQSQINRYNLYTAAGITAITTPGYSTKEGMSAMEQLTERLFNNTFGHEWTSIAYQQEQSGNTIVLIFTLAVILVILVLAAMYESWTNPFAVILGIPLALLGTVIGCFIMNLPISIYTQIGIILLIALSAKNAILIVEYAVDFRAKGMSIRDAAIEAGRIRLRPILMTSLTFIIGIIPLIFATGAGANSRIALGTAVVFGMLANTVLGILYIPNFFQITQSLHEKIIPNKETDKKAQPTKNIKLSDKTI